MGESVAVNRRPNPGECLTVCRRFSLSLSISPAISTVVIVTSRSFTITSNFAAT